MLQLASVEYGLDWPLVWRRDRLATITVSADLVGAVLPATVIGALRGEDERRCRRSLPAGYTRAGRRHGRGERQVAASVAAGLPIAALIMLIVLMVQLQSVSRLFLVLSVAPFGLIGVVLALLIAHKPMGFVAILGIIALVGMIVRNSVILVHQIETEIAHGRTSLGCGDRGHLAPLPADPAHRCRRDIRHDADRADGVLGSDGATPSWEGSPWRRVLTLVFLPALYVAWFGIREDEPAPLSTASPEGASSPPCLRSTVAAFCRPRSWPRRG